jgi:hypothetical protein
VGWSCVQDDHEGQQWQPAAVFGECHDGRVQSGRCCWVVELLEEVRRKEIESCPCT